MFNDYYEFIYLNSTLSKAEALGYARECWNRDLTKYDALDALKETLTAADVAALKDRAYILGNAGQERMLKNGWKIAIISPFDSDEEIAKQLSGHGAVRIYKGTTAVRGYHSMFAMVKG